MNWINRILKNYRDPKPAIAELENRCENAEVTAELRGNLLKDNARDISNMTLKIRALERMLIQDLVAFRAIRDSGDLPRARWLATERINLLPEKI